MRPKNARIQSARIGTVVAAAATALLTAIPAAGASPIVYPAALGDVFYRTQGGHRGQEAR